ncbi:ModD protein, partial [Parasulfuritortus cantonensis]
KALAVKAVHSGGACMHRLGLSETLMVFDEHRLFLDEVPAATVARLRRALPERALVVEVGAAAEALAWAEAGAPVIQLERFTPEQVHALAADLAARGLAPILAIAGGVNVGNAVAYAQAGAGLLVSSAPYHAPPRDVKVRFAAR